MCFACLIFFNTSWVCISYFSFRWRRLDPHDLSRRLCANCSPLKSNFNVIEARGPTPLRARKRAWKRPYTFFWSQKNWASRLVIDSSNENSNLEEMSVRNSVIWGKQMTELFVCRLINIVFVCSWNICRLNCAEQARLLFLWSWCPSWWASCDGFCTILLSVVMQNVRFFFTTFMFKICFGVHVIIGNTRRPVVKFFVVVEPHHARQCCRLQRWSEVFWRYELVYFCKVLAYDHGLLLCDDSAPPIACIS